MALTRRLGQLAYGSVFTLLLPFLLVVWAWRLDHSGMTLWPLPFGRWPGAVLALAGVALMVVSMGALWHIGKGLPMNAFPPARFVTAWTYAAVAHPIYVGFVMAVGGISIAAQSPAGLWVATPVAVLATIALVVGYEGPRLRERFAQAASHAPAFGIPSAAPFDTSPGRRLAAGLIALGPWALLYSVFSLMPEPQGAVDLRMSWEWSIKPQGWMMWIYSTAYPAVVASPLLLRTSAQLRRFVIGAWLATVIGFTLMLVLPGKAEVLALPHDGLTGWLVIANRALDARWLALPSFHALWTVFAAYCLRIRFPRSELIWVALAAAVCASCVMTGSHALVDVVVGVGLGMLLWNYEHSWRWLVRHAEALGNSWGALQIGSVRIINHAVWSAGAAATGILVVLLLAGPQLVSETAMVFTAGLLTAGGWGYWLEGGGRLSRPFGYYGFLLGSAVMLSVLALADAQESQRLTAAFATSAPLAQAIGRLRCLVQGCCHGRPVVSAVGIRIVHPYSRVTALGQLHGIPIHPTQLYSIAGNLVIFVLLWRLWQIGGTSSFIVGMYLVLSSLVRFVEEQYRGEPQTPRRFGLAIYQWFAMALFVVGILVCMIDGVSVPIVSSLTIDGALMALAAGVIAATFMSVDFPRSTWRFSRLTVSPHQ